MGKWNQSICNTFRFRFSTLQGMIVLPEGLNILSNPLFVGASGLMYCVEFFVDKIPGIDNAWDTLHTFVRILAGALWIALNHPVLFLIIFLLFIFVIIWLLPKLCRGIKKIFQCLGGFFKTNKKALHVESETKEP